MQAAGFLSLQPREREREKGRKTQGGEERWGEGLPVTLPLLIFLPLCLRFPNPHFNFHPPGCSSHLCDLIPLSSLAPATSNLCMSTCYPHHLFHPSSSLYQRISTSRPPPPPPLSSPLSASLRPSETEGDGKDFPGSEFTEELLVNKWSSLACRRYTNTSQSSRLCVSVFKRQTRRKEKKNEHLKSHFASSSLHSRLINTAVENMLEKGVNRYIHYGSTHTSNTSDTHPQAFFFSSILSCRYIHTYTTHTQHASNCRANIPYFSIY